MEMKPARPVRDRLAMQAQAVWTYQRGELMLPVPLTELRSLAMALRTCSLHTDLDTEEPLFELLEDMQYVLERMIISCLAGPVDGAVEVARMDREYPTIKSILEGR